MGETRLTVASHFTRLHDVLAQALGDVAKQTTQAGALKPVWQEAVGELAARHTQPVSLADGVLKVRADQAAWAEALSAKAPQVLARLGELLGEGRVVKLELFVSA